MIDISEKDLIGYLEKYANKEISMTELVKILNTDFRTMNNKIIKLSVDYPELYEKIITNHPYRQKGRHDIDYEALTIYILKEGITIGEATELFGISRRTIQRRINELENKNPKLYRLFQSASGRKSSKKDKENVQAEIDELEYKNVIISDINEDREKFLLGIEKEFNNLVTAGMSKEKAAEKMGYTKPAIHKMLNELYRLKIEKNSLNSAAKGFRDRLIVDLKNNRRVENNNKKNKEIKKGNGVKEENGR